MPLPPLLRPVPRRALSPTACLAVLLLAMPSLVRAQTDTTPTRARVSVTLTRTWSAESVSPRESIDAALTAVSAQFTHPLGSWAGVQWSYLAEVTPAMIVRFGASAERLELLGPSVRPLYAVRGGVGAGVAPLGVQLSRALSARTRAVAEVSGGGAIFSIVLPYGIDGTRANFTASPRLLLEHDFTTRGAFAIGYALHHISNGGFGRANPGVNARTIVVRWTRAPTKP